MSNKYLSTTKPVVQQQQQQTSKPSGGQQSKPSGGQQQTGGTQQPTGGQTQQPSGSKGDFVPGAGLIDPTKDAPDWSGYDPAGGRELTWEKIEESWKGIQ